MKVAEIVNSEKALVKLLKIDLVGVVKFDIYDIFLSVKDHLENWGQRKSEMIVKYGKREGEEYRIDESCKGFKNYLKEANEILEKEVKVKIVKIKRAKLYKAELSVQDLIALSWMIE